MSTGEWYRLTIDLDLERRTYSAEIAADGRTAESICREIEYAAKENAFNMVEIAPQGEPGSVIHLDDVSWRWKPQWHAIAPDSHVIVRDGFEDGAARLDVRIAWFRQFIDHFSGTPG